jgi:hypothetical protein
MKTLAFWHEYPGSQPEPERSVDMDPALSTFVICFLLTWIALTAAWGKR